MASIQLTSPAYANGGRYLEPGTVVVIGDGPYEILGERADVILEGERAIEVDDEAPAEAEAEAETTKPKA